MKFQVGIVLHDAYVYRISLTFGRKSRTVSLLYGVATTTVYPYGTPVFHVCTVHAQPHRRKQLLNNG